MFQMQIDSNRNKPSQALGLFARLKQEKKVGASQNEIFGVPVIQSDCSDDDDLQCSNIHSIKAKL